MNLIPEEKITNHPDLSIKYAPVLMSTAGLFGWAIRGQSGFGAVPGCVFAGVLWGITWFLLSKESGSKKSRRFGMGWTVFAFIFGIGISGMQGWGDIVALIRGTILISKNPNQIIEVSSMWGYFYMFLIGFHWAGIGSLFLAWTGSKTPVTIKIWLKRVIFTSMGFGFAWILLLIFPNLFLPLYHELDGYNPMLYDGLSDLYGEIRQALLFGGVMVGGILFEIIQKDKITLKVLLFPAIFTGLCWMLLITVWEIWIPPWATANGIVFNWWRCWESTGGGAIGLGFGITFVLWNKKYPNDHQNQRILRYSQHPNAEKLFGIFLSLVFGLSYITTQSIKGMLNIMYPTIPEMDQTHLAWVLPIVTIFSLLWVYIAHNTIQNPHKINDGTDIVPEFIKLYLFVYFLHRELGLQVTFALEYNYSEIWFFSYYILLMIFDLGLIFRLTRTSNRG
jgi:hypothetical protein